MRAEIEIQFAVLGEAGGALAIPDHRWGWGLPLRSLQGQLGYLVVGAEVEVDGSTQFLLWMLAQQTGSAIANASVHVRERDTATQLRDANRTLAMTVTALEHSTTIHDRLTAVALAGEGQEGIARALYELTGYAIAAEDAYGNLRSWAGPGQPTPYPKTPRPEREALVRRARAERHPIRDTNRLIAIADPGSGTLGVLALVDPDGTAGPQETVALEHGAIVLATELARLRSVVESELRLGRDLVDQLLTDGEASTTAAVRAQALGYDLERPHRVVVVEPVPPAHDNDEFCHAVRRAARESGVGSLLLLRAGAVVLLADTEQQWPDFQGAIANEVGGGPNRMGVGGSASQPASLARSYREALFVIKLMRSLGTGRATVFDDLGVYRLFSGIADADEIEHFARLWLASLLDYDAVHHSDLVYTLCQYLETGRRQEAAAYALNVHRSTLKYRLQRASEISGHDLSNPDTCFNLQLACRAWQTLGAMRTG